MQKIDTDNALEFLKMLAIEDRVVNYREFAIQMNINKAPIIQTVANYLEKLTIEDFNHDRPILALVVVKKNGSAIPQQGLLQLLKHLGLWSESFDSAETLSWAINEREKLKSYYSSKGISS